MQFHDFFLFSAVSKANGFDHHLDIRNDIVNYHEVTDKVSDEKQFDLIIGEPNFSISLLPWHNLFYWYVVCLKEYE